MDARIQAGAVYRRYQAAAHAASAPFAAAAQDVEHATAAGRPLVDKPPRAAS